MSIKEVLRDYEALNDTQKEVFAALAYAQKPPHPGVVYSAYEMLKEDEKRVFLSMLSMEGLSRKALDDEESCGMSVIEMLRQLDELSDILHELNHAKRDMLERMLSAANLGESRRMDFTDATAKRVSFSLARSGGERRKQ